MKSPNPKFRPDEFTPFNYPIKGVRKLNRDFELRNSDFLEVLLNRRSEQALNGPLLTNLSELLYYSNKIHSIYIDDFGYALTKRTAPSAGARHPVDLLVSFSVGKEKRILEYYNPIDHSLSELSISENDQRIFFKEIEENLSIGNACVIWFSIQRDKTGAKYENPESLYWRDAGALLHCIQITAAHLGLKSCPIGSLAEKSFYSLFKSDLLLSFGGILVGV